MISVILWRTRKSAEAALPILQAPDNRLPAETCLHYRTTQVAAWKASEHRHAPACSKTWSSPVRISTKVIWMNDPDDQAKVGLYDTVVGVSRQTDVHAHVLGTTVQQSGSSRNKAHS
jgi:hypothetical protein